MAAKRKSVILNVIRCGETPWATGGRMQGGTDLPLSDEGADSVRRDAGAVVTRSIGWIYHPSDDAATETARIVAGAVGARTKSVPELRDADLGIFEGITRQAFADRYPKRYKQWLEDPLNFSPPEGEDVVDARSRLFAALGRLLRRTRSEEVAVVLHPLSTGLLRCWLADLPPADAWALVRDRPRIERYLVALDSLTKLEGAGRVEVTQG